MKTKATVSAALGLGVFLLAHPFHAGGGPITLEARCQVEAEDSNKPGGRSITDLEQFCGITQAAESPTAPAEAPEDRPPDHLLTPESLAEGRRTFYVHCTFCHGQEGNGGLGQKLTDNETLHGGRFADILNVISNGVEMKGMRAYMGILGAERVAQTAAYVYTLKGTKPPSTSKIRFGALIFLAPGVAVLLP